MQNIRLRKAWAIDEEEGRIPDDDTSGILLSKVQQLQQRNIELESTVNSLKYQVDYLKMHRLKSDSSDDNNGKYDKNLIHLSSRTKIQDSCIMLFLFFQI